MAIVDGAVDDSVVLVEGAKALLRFGTGYRRRDVGACIVGGRSLGNNRQQQVIQTERLILNLSLFEGGVHCPCEC